MADLMEEVGAPGFKSDDGVTVSQFDDFHASPQVVSVVASALSDALSQWLREGHVGRLKHQLLVIGNLAEQREEIEEADSNQVSVQNAFR